MKSLAVHTALLGILGAFMFITIAWLNHRRRLAKDRENLNRKTLVLLRLASIRLTFRQFRKPA
jgi:hypothetical protein